MNRRRNLTLRLRGARIGLLALASFGVLAGIVPAAPMPAMMDAGLARTVENVLPIARRKLMRANCRRIFQEFRDRSGQTLLRKLQARGETPMEHLMGIEFREGNGISLCRNENVLATSFPGERMVQLCGERFQAAARRSASYAANILIHEQLHALGLQENPPSSEEITQRVTLRCGW